MPKLREYIKGRLRLRIPGLSFLGLCLPDPILPAPTCMDKHMEKRNLDPYFTTYKIPFLETLAKVK